MLALVVADSQFHARQAAEKVRVEYEVETPVTDPFGYPLRLRTSTKLGYKNAKWIKAIEVTNDFRETFWSKQGFNWFAGI